MKTPRKSTAVLIGIALALGSLSILSTWSLWSKKASRSQSSTQLMNVVPAQMADSKAGDSKVRKTMLGMLGLGDLVEKFRTPASSIPPSASKPSASLPSVPLTGQVQKTAGQGEKAQPDVALAPPAQCFAIHYSHKPLPQHSSDEACSHHRNLIRLNHSSINKGSLCVRVNGIPVAYEWVKGKGDEILIGSVAGPKADITANYCLAGVKCQQECKVPRDEFMDAIGGSDDSNAQLGKWDSGDPEGREQESAKLDSQIRQEMAEIEGSTDIFSGWLPSVKSDDVLACVPTEGKSKRQIASAGKKTE